MSTPATRPAPHAHTEDSGTCCKGSDGASTCCGGKGKVPDELARDLTRPLTRQELEQLPTLHLIMRFRRGIENVDRRVFELTERQIDQAFLPDANVGLWPVRVLLGHLADAEVGAAHRMRRIVGEDNPVVAMWDENAFIDAGVYGNGAKEYADSPESDRARVMQALGGFLAVIHTLRQWMGQWLLTLPDQAWSRTLMHPTHGPLTLRQYLAAGTWHLEHHAAFLTRKLDRMGIPVEQEEAHAGCGCKH